MGVKLPTGNERVRVLYEEYIHLGGLKKVWETPLTDRPELEPCFAAAFHGIELCFLLLAEFITDKRSYVAKRPRIELVANDIRAQCQLLSDIVDGELEEEGVPVRHTLTQDFPFEHGPPTCEGRSHSPGLQRLIAAVTTMLPVMSSAERNSLSKVVLNITSAFASAFERWTVGLGIEWQLNTLLSSAVPTRGAGRQEQAAAGTGAGSSPPRAGWQQVPAALLPERSRNLDYCALVRPEVVEATLTQEVYSYAEDFFFRTVHLGTECWMYVCIKRISSALEMAAAQNWHVAAARVLQAARILHYLGDHLLLLTSMNLRDYLYLKVELEGTSGAGSSLVRSIRALVLQLMVPFRQMVLQGVPPVRGLVLEDMDAGPADQQLLASALTVYEQPDMYPGLYNYAKAMEDVETALLSGFYYKHFCLAQNVIGSQARGTMKRLVTALKPTYETQLYPVLDNVRSLLGQRVDEELAHIKGRMMDDIIARYSGAAGGGQQQQQQQQEAAQTAYGTEQVPGPGPRQQGAEGAALPAVCPVVVAGAPAVDVGAGERVTTAAVVLASEPAAVGRGSMCPFGFS